LNRNALTDAPPAVSGVVDGLRKFLLEPLHAAARSESLSKSWPPGGPWA
jgi:hypothetical protein